MDPQYLTGIDEIDAQHAEIEEITQAVIEAAAAKDKWHVVHYILVRLYELLRFHFSVEEAVMSIVSFPEIKEHKQVHKDILLTVERMKVASLDPLVFEQDESLIKQFSFHTHIANHDKRFAEFVMANISSLRH
jgi:hemerythrin-like metal-binding protein